MSIQPTLDFSFSRFVLMTAMLVAISCASQTVSAQAAKSRKIRVTLTQMVAKEKIPGMIAAICDADGVLAIGSAGVRKAGAKAAFTKDDVVHIGSCTKAMTSMMLATLVADGTMTWNTTLIEVFPEYMNNVHAGYHNVTLWQLITHRAGIPENANDWWVHTNRPIKERRLAILTENLKKASEASRGEYHYSNLGYMVAGCMAEKLSGSTWESLMQERVFNPLNMTSAGFGPPGAARQVDQPWGHIKSESQDGWQPKQHDNAEALGPAGRVHCTMEDWAKFVSQQLPRNKAPIIDRQHLDKLIEPSSQYAAGWNVVQRPWAQGNALTHSGSNTMWYATVWVAPELNRAYMVATNSCNDNSNAICDKLISELIAIDREIQ